MFFKINTVCIYKYNLFTVCVYFQVGTLHDFYSNQDTFESGKWSIGNYILENRYKMRLLRQIRTSNHFKSKVSFLLLYFFSLSLSKFSPKWLFLQHTLMVDGILCSNVFYCVILFTLLIDGLLISTVFIVVFKLSITPKV